MIDLIHWLVPHLAPVLIGSSASSAKRKIVTGEIS
jgi:hypothetical protein